MSKKDEFFVGYLQTPDGLARFYKWIIPLLILLAISASVWTSSSQKGSSQSALDLTTERTITGYLTVDPYPVLHFSGESQRSVILVDEVKKSATEIAAPFADQWVSVSGYFVESGDWSLLQLSASSIFKPTTPRKNTQFQKQKLAEVTLDGEILDSKCFLGAMKPGYGKVHRACASLCLRGGIPPMFYVKQPSGNAIAYMLTNPDGSSASIKLAQHVAVPVRLKGQLEQRGDMIYIRLKDNHITPLTGHDLASYGQTLARLDEVEEIVSHHQH